MTLRPRNDISLPDGAERDASAERYLPALSGAMCAELLENRSVPVSGLGMFTIRHLPAERRSGKEGMQYHPPENRVVFEKRDVAVADFVKMISMRMHLERSECGPLASVFPLFFKNRMREQGSVVFPGFGTLFSEKGRLGFETDALLQELINSEYRNLGAIALSSPPAPEPLRRKRRLPVMVAAGIVLAAIASLFVFLWQNQGALPVAADRPVISLSGADKDVTAAGGDAKSGTLVSARDGALLEVGEYAVVLATFQRKQSALQERRRIMVPGAVIFIWPVTGGGKQYYRLAAGRFRSSGAAAAWMDSTGLGRDGKAYIQQAKRRVVPHGEEGL